LELLTTDGRVGIVSIMRAVERVRSRIVYSGHAFAELILWRLSQPMAGSLHRFKYRLAYVVEGVPVLRYDNETGKGDHRHEGSAQWPYSFSTPDRLIADFLRDIERWNHENRHA
jgi:hypothetical protein